jgi:hypothetical protein
LSFGFLVDVSFTYRSIPIKDGTNGQHGWQHGISMSTAVYHQIMLNYSMKQTVFLTLVLLVIFLSPSKAQVLDKKTVHAGESLSALFYYRFPAFTDANVKLKNGGAGPSKMNFNLLVCEMQFIDPHGDTLSIAKPQDIDSISLGGSTFFYKDGYQEMIRATNLVKLLVVRKVVYEPIEIGAMGLRTHTGVGIKNYSSLIANAGEKQLTLNVDIDIAMETTYFLAANDEMLKVSKTAFLTLFPKNGAAIQGYIKSNKPAFNKEEDIKKLFDFCAGLQ